VISLQGELAAERPERQLTRNSMRSDDVGRSRPIVPNGRTRSREFTIAVFAGVVVCIFGNMLLFAVAILCTLVDWQRAASILNYASNALWAWPIMLSDYLNGCESRCPGRPWIFGLVGIAPLPWVGLSYWRLRRKQLARQIR
jgi:hypothetical protein